MDQMKLDQSVVLFALAHLYSQMNPNLLLAFFKTINVNDNPTPELSEMMKKYINTLYESLRISIEGDLDIQPIDTGSTIVH